jgi:hypothetical protein
LVKYHIPRNIANRLWERDPEDPTGPYVLALTLEDGEKEYIPTFAIQVEELSSRCSEEQIQKMLWGKIRDLSIKTQGSYFQQMGSRPTVIVLAEDESLDYGTCIRPEDEKPVVYAMGAFGLTFLDLLLSSKFEMYQVKKLPYE